MNTEGTTARVLKLLGLLQRRPTWTATELAAELDLTDRCIRRDVERLRSLGYPVRATAGVGGGYQLGAGSRLPPLLLDDEEATATAVSLQLAATSAVTGAGEAAVRALTKLDQVMPPRLRAQVQALQHATSALSEQGADVDADALVTIARACRDLVRIRFRYAATGASEATERSVEPVRMVTTGRRWYLMGFDLDRDDWRTYRVDRMSAVEASTWRFQPREHPDPVAYVQDAISTAPYRHHARVRLRGPAKDVRRMVPASVARVEDDGDDGWCVLTAGGDDLDWLAMHIAALGLDTEILEPPDLREAAAALADHLTRMAAPATPTAATAPPLPTDAEGEA